MEDGRACAQPPNHVDSWIGGAGLDQGVVTCASRMTLERNEPIVKDPDPRIVGEIGDVALSAEIRSHRHGLRATAP